MASQPPTQPGQAATLLPTGAWLLTGGGQAASLIHLTGASTPLASQPGVPRQGHSATLLPDGSVLILGGLNTQGQVVAQAERFDPTTQAFQAFTPYNAPGPGPGVLPRAWHSATVLADGRVLITGGQGANAQPIAHAELYNPATGQAEAINALLEPTRWRHVAALLPTSQAPQVLLWGGQGNTGTLNHASLFDAQGQRFTPADAAQASQLAASLNDARPPSVLGTEPSADSQNVAPDARLVVRLSKRMAVETLNPINTVLTGPNGPVAVRVTPVERGLLVFIQPLQELTPGTRYTLMVSGATDLSGQPLPLHAIGFNTRSLNTGGTQASTGQHPGFNRDSGAQSVEARRAQRPNNPPNAQPRPPMQQSWRDDDGEQEEWTPGQSHRKGNNWRTGRRRTAAQDLPPLQAPTGVTALSGQALTLHGRPLAGVTLSLADQTTQTDRSGRFLLQNLPAGQQVLAIDATSANRAKASYGYYEAQVQVKAGETTALDYTIWMAKLDQAHAVELPSPTTQETVLTHPAIPGLEVRMPAGTVLRGKDGQIVTRVTLTPIPVDRPPFPLPEGVDVPVYFTVQPGATRIENIHNNAGGTRLIYPNFTKQPPGSRVLFWDHDPHGKGWYVYGGGKVSGDGQQSIPDAGVAIYQFTGAMVGSPNMAPTETTCPAPPKAATSGLIYIPSMDINTLVADPVDTASGVFIHSRVDMRLPDVIPIEFERTYRSRDPQKRAFGRGTTHAYDLYLVGTIWPYTFQELMLPSGARVRFDRSSSGTDFADAVYVSKAPGPFNGARIDFTGGSFDLAWKLTTASGEQYFFPDREDNYVSTRSGFRKYIDASGNTLLIERNGPNESLSKITSPNGKTITTSHDSEGRISRLTSSAGTSVTYDYDGSGRLTRVTDAEGRSESYTYDSFHNMTKVTDARGNAMATNIYHPLHQGVTQQQLADGAVFQFNYIFSNHVPANPTAGPYPKHIATEVTDPRGKITRHVFDTNPSATHTEEYRLQGGAPALQEVLAQGTALQRTRTLQKDATGRTTQSTDALGRVLKVEYNSDGEIEKFTGLHGTASAASMQIAYDATFKNQPRTVTNPLGHTTTYTYDAKGNVSRITNPLGHNTDLVYDAQGKLTRVTNALGHATQLNYTGGALSSITDPLGRTTTLGHNAFGTPSNITDPLGNKDVLLRDKLGRVTSQIDPMGQTTQIRHDANGNLTEVTTPKGGVYSTRYDPLNRPNGSTDPLNRTDSAEYDGNGNLTKSTDRKGQVTLNTYDALDRLKQVRFHDGSTIDYTWDAGNRVTKIADGINGTFDYTYDAHDRLTQEAGPKGTVNYSYDAAGRRTGMQVIAQSTTVSTSYAYDAADRLTRITQAAGASNDNQAQVTTYAWDAANRLTSKTLPNGITATYTWDAASQLKEIGYAKGGNSLGKLTYSYDAAGRRTSIGGTLANPQRKSAANEASYDAANQMTTLNTQAITYDANGNMTSDGQGNSYTWNARNQLQSISGPGGTASFTYDAVGRRSSKTINGATTGFLHDGANLIQEQDAWGAPYVNLLTGLSIDETVARYPINGGASAAEVMVTDALGSTIALTNHSGAITTSYAYDTYGGTTQTGAPSTNPIQYTGRENDGINGLYYYRARYYSTNAQRFISEDPIGLGGGINTHAYVGGNPLSFTDPMGLQAYMCQNAGLGAWCGPSPVGPRRGALEDFWDNYKDMREANTIGADKYFHCKANCEASRRGPAGQRMSCLISDVREWFDQTVKRDPAAASAADQAANEYGRSWGATPTWLATLLVATSGRVDFLCSIESSTHEN